MFAWANRDVGGHADPGMRIGEKEQMQPARAALARIAIFPIKSLNGIELTHTAISAGGALKHDREYAIVDGQGRFVNGKRHPLIHQLRAKFDLDQSTVAIGIPDHPKLAEFELGDGDRLIFGCQ